MPSATLPVLLPQGPRPASGLQNRRTRSHVLRAHGVASDLSSPSLPTSSSPHVWAYRQPSWGRLPFNPPLAPKLARGLVNTHMVQGHGLPAIPLPPGLPLTEGQPPPCSSVALLLVSEPPQAPHSRIKLQLLSRHSGGLVPISLSNLACAGLPSSTQCAINPSTSWASMRLPMLVLPSEMQPLLHLVSKALQNIKIELKCPAWPTG